MGALRCDFGAFWAAFWCGSFVNYVMVGFRGCRSGGLPAVLGRDFSGKIVIFAYQFLCLGGLPGITRSGIWLNTGAFRCDFGAFWAAFRCGSVVLYVMVGFRGGRPGGLPAVLKLDFHEKSCFCEIIFASLGVS